MIRSYTTPGSFKAALEDRLQTMGALRKTLDQAVESLHRFI